MSKEFGFFGDMKLDGWNADARSALNAIKNGDVKRALIYAENVDDSYQKHWRVTHRLETAALIIALFFIVVAVILGLASGEWVIAIVIGVIGLLLSGIFELKIVDKRKAVYNAFNNTYHSLMNALKELQNSQMNR